MKLLRQRPTLKLQFKFKGLQIYFTLTFNIKTYVSI